MRTINLRDLCVSLSSSTCRLYEDLRETEEGHFLKHVFFCIGHTLPHVGVVAWPMTGVSCAVPWTVDHAGEQV